jgi:hypothetical protein
MAVCFVIGVWGCGGGSEQGGGIDQPVLNFPLPSPSVSTTTTTGSTGGTSTGATGITSTTTGSTGTTGTTGSTQTATALKFVTTVPDANTATNITVNVAAIDKTGNVVTSFTGPVTLTLNLPPGVSGPTLSGGGPVNAVNGVATFTIQVSQAVNGATLTATSSNLTPATSNAFNIGVMIPTSLDFTNYGNDVAAAQLERQVLVPGTVNAATYANDIVVQMLDQFGNPLATGSNNISVTMYLNDPPTVDLLPGATSPTLTGTTTVVLNSQGQAVYTDLAVDGVTPPPSSANTTQQQVPASISSGFSLKASANFSNVASATSSQFQVSTRENLIEVDIYADPSTVSNPPVNLNQLTNQVFDVAVGLYLNDTAHTFTWAAPTTPTLSLSGTGLAGGNLNPNPGTSAGTGPFFFFSGVGIDAASTAARLTANDGSTTGQTGSRTVQVFQLGPNSFVLTTQPNTGVYPVGSSPGPYTVPAVVNVQDIHGTSMPNTNITLISQMLYDQLLPLGAGPGNGNFDGNTTPMSANGIGTVVYDTDAGGAMTFSDSYSNGAAGNKDELQTDYAWVLNNQIYNVVNPSTPESVQSVFFTIYAP